MVVELELEGVVGRVAGVDALVHCRRARKGRVGAHNRCRARGVGARARIQVVIHELVFALCVHIIEVDGHVCGDLPLDAHRKLIGISNDPIRVIESNGASVLDSRPRREKLIEQIAIDHRSIGQHRIRRSFSSSGTGIGSIRWEIRGKRVGVDPSGFYTLNQLQMRLDVEPPGAPAKHGGTRRRKLIGEADARREVVLVVRILLPVGKERIVRLGERNLLQVIAQTEAQRRMIADVPFVLSERAHVGDLPSKIAGARHCDLQAFRIRREIVRIEGVRSKREGPVQVVLADCVLFGALVLHAELHVVPVHVPVESVVELPGVVDSRLGGIGLLVAVAEKVERRRQGGLIPPVAVEARIGESHVLLRPGQSRRIDPRITSNQIVLQDRRLIDVGFLTRRRRRDRIAVVQSDDLIELWRRLTKPSRRPGVAGVDLMIDTHCKLIEINGL